MARQGFIGSLSALEFDGRAAKLLLHNTSIEIMKVGVRAWLAKAEDFTIRGSDVGMPIWSGASRATLQPVADIIGEQVSKFGQRAPGAPNRVSEGLGSATAELKIQRGKYSFKYTSDLYHLEVNNDNDARQWGFRLIHPGPYKFIEQCNKAFYEAVAKELANFSIRFLIAKNLKVRSERF